MEIPEGARNRLETDHVVWLTTVTDDGVPVPYPVWFVVDGDDVVVFSKPSSRRVRNIGARPAVSLHFNSDPHGGDVWIITGTARTTPNVVPSSLPAYLAKYRDSIEHELHTTVAEIDATYDTEIRIHPERVLTV